MSFGGEDRRLNHRDSRRVQHELADNGRRGRSPPAALLIPLTAPFAGCGILAVALLYMTQGLDLSSEACRRGIDDALDRREIAYGAVASLMMGSLLGIVAPFVGRVLSRIRGWLILKIIGTLVFVALVLRTIQNILLSVIAEWPFIT